MVGPLKYESPKGTALKYYAFDYTNLDVTRAFHLVIPILMPSLSLRAKFLNFFLFFPLKLSVTLISYRINSKFFNLASKSTYYWASVYISKLRATTPPPCSLPVDLMEPVIGPYSRAVLSHNVEYSSSQQLHI